jgi:hypothetical protein
MRTTLILDDDVAALLGRVQETRNLSLDVAVNQALRQWLKQMDEPLAPRKRYDPPSLDLGECYLSNVDDISEVLAFAEGEDYR